MRESDAHTIEKYVPGRTLMYRAAMGVYRAAEWKGSVAILTGAGNNGGDGYALACILAERGLSCEVLRVSERFSEDGRYFHDRAAERKVPIRMFTEGTDLSGYDILVDCLLGTGFSGQVEGLYRAAIEAMNGAGNAFVISVDINSGLNGDTGRAGQAVRSDLTVTIGYLKSGLLLGDAGRYMGRLAVAEIGIRLIREDFFLVSGEEAIFPNTGLVLNGDRVEMLTPGEAEALLKNGETVPELAVELALRGEKLIRILGQYPLVTDGYRTYFVTDGAMPEEIVCRDEI